MREEFCIAAFRSRQQVMAFERDLRQHGVRASVMITPRAVAMGCGLSVRIEREDLRRAVQVYRATNPGNLASMTCGRSRQGGRLCARRGLSNERRRLISQ